MSQDYLSLDQIQKAIKATDGLNPYEQAKKLNEIFRQTKTPESYSYDKESPHPRLAILGAMAENAKGLANGSYDSHYSGDELDPHPDSVREYGMEMLGESFSKTTELMLCSAPPKESDLYKKISDLGRSIGNTVLEKSKEDGIKVGTLEKDEINGLSSKEKVYLNTFRNMTIGGGPAFQDGEWIEELRLEAKVRETRLEDKEKLGIEHKQQLKAAEIAAQAESARLEAERKTNTPMKKILGMPKSVMNKAGNLMKPLASIRRKQNGLNMEDSLPGDR